MRSYLKGKGEETRFRPLPSPARQTFTLSPGGPLYAFALRVQRMADGKTVVGLKNTLLLK